jgi:hypothetical protein
MELLDIYQDLLDTQVRTHQSAESVTDEFEEQENDRTSVHSLIKRLDKHSPPEPGTSKSHADGLDLRGPDSRYRRAVSQLAAVLEDMDTTMENPDPSSSLEMNHRILPSPLEWASFIRECVSPL